MVASRSQGGSAPATPELMTGATWAGRGDDRLNASGVQYWNNRVAGGTDLLAQADASFRPTAITDTFGGTPATVDGVHFGAGGAMDQFDAPLLSSFIGLNQWHIFALVKFSTIDYVANLTGISLIFTATSTLSGAFATSFSLDARKTAGGAPIIYGYFVNTASTGYSVSAPLTLGAAALIEFWGDSSTMSLRVNAAAAVTSAYTGNLLNHAVHKVRVGSINYEGGWDYDTNRLYELAVANQKNATVANIRNYFAARYNVAV